MKDVHAQGLRTGQDEDKRWEDKKTSSASNVDDYGLCALEL